MPRNMSFALTTDQIRNRTKTVTRRLGWKFLKAGDLINACVKCMGLRPGEKVERLALLRVYSVRREPLRWIERELDGAALEGFPELSEWDFVERFCRHMKCDRNVEVTRIEFEYVDQPEGIDA